MKKIKNSNYQYAFGNRFSMLILDASSQRFIKYRDILCNDLDDVFNYSVNGYETTYFSLKDVKKMQDSGRKMLDTRFRSNIQKEIKRLIQDYESFKIERKEDYSNFSNKQLADIFERLMDYIIKTAAYFTLSRPEPMHSFNEKMNDFAKNNNKLIIILTTPDKPGIILKEKEEWLKTCKNYSKKSLKSFAFRFPYLFLNVYSYEDAMIFLENKYENTNIKALKEEIREDYKKLRDIKEKQKKILKKYPKLKQYSDYIKEAGLQRFFMRDIFSGYEFIFLPLFKEIAKRRKIDLEEMMFTHNIAEISVFLRKSKKISKKKVKERKKRYAIHVYNKKALYFSGEKLKRILEERLKGIIPDPNIREFKGQIGNPGYAKGKVCLVMSDDFMTLNKVSKYFEKKNILVCPNTTPIITPLIKKAGAIVTDEGGIASHASIISREFNIPSVIGTHIATKVLHEKDYIEVDANKGIVKILMRYMGYKGQI